LIEVACAPGWGDGLLQFSWMVLVATPLAVRFVGAAGACVGGANSPNTLKVPDAGLPPDGPPPSATKTRPLVTMALVNLTDAESWSRVPAWLLLYSSVKLPVGWTTPPDTGRA